MVEVTYTLTPSAGVTNAQIFVEGALPAKLPSGAMGWRLGPGSYHYTIMISGAAGDQAPFTINSPTGQLAAGTTVISAGFGSGVTYGPMTV